MIGRDGDDARRLVGLAALAVLVCVAVPLGAAGPALVPGSIGDGPRWVLGVFGGGLGISGGVFLGLLWVAFIAWTALVVTAPALPPRMLWGTIVGLVGLFVVAPPLLSQDVFSYLAYARMDATHGLNPYADVPRAISTDRVFPHVGWRDAVSAYGPLFSLVTHPLGRLPVEVAFWLWKGVVGVAVLALAALTARLARARGVQPERAAAFVALNPLVLVHVVGGAHNDALLALGLVFSALALASGLPGVSGAGIVAAVGLKFSAGFAAPFALLAALRPARFVAGVVAASATLVGVALAVYGADVLDAVGLAGENQEATSRYSVPATFSRALGVDVDTVRIVALVAYAGLVGWLLLWTARGADWIRGAGWAGLGLLLATGWLLPWYVIWILPLVAVARDRPLATAAIALTGFQLINRVPL